MVTRRFFCIFAVVEQNQVVIEKNGNKDGTRKSFQHVMKSVRRDVETRSTSSPVSSNYPPVYFVK